MARQPTRRSKDYQAPAPSSSSAERSRSRRSQQVRPVGEVKTQTGQKRERGGGRQFISESVAELRKVEWPGQRQLVSATVVVLLAIAVVGFYLWVADEAFSRLVREVLLR